MQLLLHQPGDTPVILLIQEGVTQCDPFSMVLYGITLFPLVEELRDAYSTLLSPLYADDAVFDGLARRSVVQLRLLLDQGPDRVYISEPAKLIFIANNPEEKEAAKREFEQAGLHLNYVDGSRYLGFFWGIDRI